MTAPLPSPFPTPKPVPLAVVIGRRVKECRHLAGKSQETVAFEAGIDRTYISAVERGAANPSVEALANICHVLNVTLSELFKPLDGVSLAPTGERRSNVAKPAPVKRNRFR
ncbi:helix-turn-helix domain-containing protein [Comamonas terrigena]|uniref:helix-turn-helix domain-containing protein n=1 Tax=Comamonas terrigena TaxID=32013 RepID=UPI00244946AF|nr:helix-turn-helix transcriptional regulator [Comamonas terrigena]MDH0049254.1 helix-turn-helix domain-containing protein [Comamonas terrigena]MDH0511957.1 helix-turn-helix domain-containing protein [Comamonas terrigena]MDH1091665.1 helix-turn-helix domain-containing protein [Comamonas terrigena]